MGNGGHRLNGKPLLSKRRFLGSNPSAPVSSIVVIVLLLKSFMLLVLALLFSGLLVLVACAVAGFIFFSMIVGQLKGAPFVPSKPKRIAAMIELADIKKGDRVCDLGSGNGAVLFAAARRGAVGIGVEFNPFLVWFSRLRAQWMGLGDKVSFVRQNLHTYPLSDADVVFLYLWPSTITALREKLMRELKPGARVISNAFAIPEWKPTAERDGVFLYQKSV